MSVQGKYELLQATLVLITSPDNVVANSLWFLSVQDVDTDGEEVVIDLLMDILRRIDDRMSCAIITCTITS